MKKADQTYNEKEFAIFCLTQYFRGNKRDLSIASAELKASGKTSIEFLELFLQRKNEEQEAIKRQIAHWQRLYAKKKTSAFLLKKIVIPLVAILLIAGIYFTWRSVAAGNRSAPVANTDRLFVLTTSGFRARNSPNSPGGYRRLFRYGDTVTNLHDTLNGWLKFDYQGRSFYGPSKYFATEDVFFAHDSLFKDYHYDPTFETINSKAAFCIKEFITNTLRSSVKEWHIPLQSLASRPARHAVLSLPRAVDFVKVEGEGELEKYHLLLISRRTIRSADSVNHYALLLELLPNGSVIKRADFPLPISDAICYITVNNVDRFLKGHINGNVFLRTEAGKLLRLTWSKGMEAPIWQWMD